MKDELAQSGSEVLASIAQVARALPSDDRKKLSAITGDKMVRVIILQVEAETGPIRASSMRVLAGAFRDATNAAERELARLEAEELERGFPAGAGLVAPPEKAS